MGRKHKLTANIKQPSRGRFITFEGGEGVGKSTQVSLLRAALRRAGIGNPLPTREPGGSAGAEEIRRLLVEGDPGRWDGMTEALLHCAARRDHLVRTIWPALATGRWVVCDRFVDSTFAYQGSGQEVDMARLLELTVLVTENFAPDLTVILDVLPQTGLQRAATRAATQNTQHARKPDFRKQVGRGRYEGMDLSFHFRLHQAFRTIAAAEPERCVVIDASLNIPLVHAAVLAAVADRLGVDLGHGTRENRKTLSYKMREWKSS